MTIDATFAVVGHVDHGKTALVEALTGIVTDRLPEERERGLSIVLGFAYFETESATIDLIDVPGHEDFIRAMVAGVTGIDGIVLVVAANEGIMPQTREHFAIARLLGVECGIIAISKCDLATAKELAGLTKAIGELAAGTFLAEAPIVRTSATGGTGVAELRAAIEAAIEPRLEAPGRDFFLPIDRVFSMRGFGVIATGTLRRGALRVDDRVALMPRGLAATVRGLQRHRQTIGEARPGQRVAVNLRGVERGDLERGDTLARPGLLRSTRRIDAQVQLLATESAALANGARVRLLTGTTEVLARVRWLDRETLLPGASGLAQFRCEAEIVTLPGERVLLRTYSPMRTIAGGRVLDAAPPRHRRFDDEILRRLTSRAAGDTEQMLADLLVAAGPRGIDVKAAAAELGLSEDLVNGHLDSQQAVWIDPNRAIAGLHFDAICGSVLALLERFHAEHPYERGIPQGAAKAQIAPVPDANLWDAALAALAADQRIGQTEGIIALRGFDPLAGFTADERRIADAIEAAFRRAGIEPPLPADVTGADRRAQGLFRMLLERGRLVRLDTYARGTQLVLHAETLAAVKQRLAGRFPHPQRFTLAEARDLLGSTRRHVTPLMEHLDAAGFTIRIGDTRQLRAR
jgi:selenocysteine-specific elongation factor